MTKRGEQWQNFANEVFSHIEQYTAPQYGDEGEDPVSDYSAEDCVNQAKKYLARFGKNARPGQERLDMLKAAHYIQMAALKMKGE